jgi:nitrate/nitrite-specific signal transduction histidine kinase
MFQKPFDSYVLLFAIPILSGFIIGGFFVYINYRRSVLIYKKQKNHFLLQIENEKIIISRELHDAIAPFTLPLKEFFKKRGIITIEDENTWLNEINKFEAYLTNINESIFPSELLDGDLNVALQIMTQKLITENKKIVLHAQFTSNISKQFSIQIFRIVQESLINAIKYSGSNLFNLICTQNENDLICTVNFEINENTTNENNFNSLSRGRKIISQRLELLSGKYESSIDENIKTEKFTFKDIYR